jgi:2-amino-4-hydroxy-6-hydroxymethyldihydropteridine diphosphokinase
VLVPLAEIAPEKVIAGMRMADALARVDTRGVVKLRPRSQ